MAYTKGSVFTDRNMRVLIGSACYVEIALVTGEWDLIELEKIINHRHSDEKWNNYRHLVKGSRLQDESIARIRHAPRLQGKRCHIKKWRDHPFWDVLKMSSITYENIENALLVVTGPVQNEIWFDKRPMTKRPARYDDLGNFMIDSIARAKSFNGLIALIALARESYHSNHPRTFYNAAKKSLEIFPHAVVKCPHIYIRWQALAKQLTDVIWSRTADFDTFEDLVVSHASLARSINSLDLEARKKHPNTLPPKHIIDRYNKS